MRVIQIWLLVVQAPTSEEAPSQRNDHHPPVVGETNRWCVKGQLQIYWDAKMLNDKEMMSWLITEEHWVLRGDYIQCQRYTGYSTSTSAIGWHGTLVHTVRRLCRSSMQPMLPLSEGRFPSGPSPQNRTLSLWPWPEVDGWTSHRTPYKGFYTDLPLV